MAENKKVQIKNTGGDSLFPRATLDNIGVNMASNTTMIASGGKILNSYLPSATSTEAGTVQLATDVETSSGTVTGKAVTPAGMKNAMTWTAIQDKGTSTIVVQPGGVYRGTCLTGSRTISANATSESMYGADAYVEMFLDKGTNVKTTGALTLMTPLTAGAGNNCVVKFRGGRAYMYQESTDAGYLVTNSSGESATSGSLAYGIANGNKWIVVPSITSNSIMVGYSSTKVPVSTHVNILGKITSGTSRQSLYLYCDLTSGGISLRDVDFSGGDCTTDSATSATTPIRIYGHCGIGSIKPFTNGGVFVVTSGATLEGRAGSSGGLNFSSFAGIPSTLSCTNATLKDLKITNLNSSPSNADHGPIMKAFNGGSACLDTVTLTSARACLGTAYSRGDLTLSNCTVQGIGMMADGAIVGFTSQSKVTMSGCVFNYVRASSGTYESSTRALVSGVISGFGGLEMHGCTIQSNVMPFSNCKTIFVSKHFADSSGTFNMSNCFITGNTAYNGGAMTLYPAAGDILDCNITDNVASSGGALHLSGYDTNRHGTVFNRCIISGNTATVGDLAYVEGAFVTFKDCTLGGTIYNAGSGYGSITIIGSNKLDTEVQADATNSQTILISAGATLDLTQCEHHTSNVLYSPLSNGIRVGYWSRGTWTQEGTATVIPYGGGANVYLSGSFQKLNRDGTTA